MSSKSKGEGLVAPFKTAMTDDTFNIDVRQIVCNSVNPRDSIPTLSAAGYGIFEPVPGSDKPALVPLVVSGDPLKMGEFVSLMDEYEPANIVALAGGMAQSGQLNAVVVRTTAAAPDGYSVPEVVQGLPIYDLTAGLRRVLGLYYLYAKGGAKAAPAIRARLMEMSDKDAELAALSENLHILSMGVVSQGRRFAAMKKSGKSLPTIAKATGVDVQTIENRLLVATSDKLTEEERTLLDLGMLSQRDALAKIKGGAPPATTAGDRTQGAPSKVKITTGQLEALFLGKATSEGKFLSDYGVEGDGVEVVRAFLAKLLHTTYRDVAATLAKFKIDPEAEKEKAKKLKAGERRKRATKAEKAKNDAAKKNGTKKKGGKKKDDEPAGEPVPAGASNDDSNGDGGGAE